jgi:hypothetical protein
MGVHAQFLQQLLFTLARLLHAVNTNVPCDAEEAALMQVRVG